MLSFFDSLLSFNLFILIASFLIAFYGFGLLKISEKEESKKKKKKVKKLGSYSFLKLL